MIKVILLSWFITEFEPIQLFLDRIFTFLHFKTSGTMRELNTWIHSAFGCMKCLSFWIGLFTGGFFFGLTCSIISQLIQLCLQRLK